MGRGRGPEDHRVRTPPEVSEGPEHDAARDAASIAAREADIDGIVTAVVVVYRLVDQDGGDQVGWLYDGSKPEAVGLLELAKADLLGFDE